MIKKIWDWIKSLAKLPRLLPGQHGQEEPDPAPGVLTDLDKQLGERIQRRQATERAIAARSADPNMPRYQRCACGRWGKRTQKAELGGKAGAFYKCSVHGEFFVGR
jgi:hypothetical protein